MKRIPCLVVLALTALSTVNLFAQWPSSAEENLLICDHTGEQALPKIAATSDGGCYLCWQDNTSGSYDVYLQRLDSDGVPQWEDPCGILVSDHAQETWLTDWDMTVDHEDFCIIALNDIRAGGDWDIYGYRIGPDGEFDWGADGIAVSDNANFEPDPRVCVTSSGNIAFTWQEATAEGSVINLRKLTTDGLDVYPLETITITAEHPLSIPRLAAAENDAVLLQWLVQQGTEWWQPRWIYMQKFDSLGNELWVEDGAEVMTTGGIGVQMRPDLVHDGSGGAYSFWYDTRNNDHHVFVQHLNELGVVQWTTDGVNVDNSASELQMSPDLVVVDDGVVIYYQATNMGQSQGGIQVQKLNQDGEPQWDTGIVVVPFTVDASFNLQAFVQDGNTAIFYSQYAPGSAINTVLRAVQHTPAGPPAWDPAIRDLCSVLSEKGRPHVCVNPLNQVIAAWPDSRIESGNIYVQNINPDGSLGPLDEPQPWIDIISPAQDTTVHSGVQVVSCEIGNFVLGLDGFLRLTAIQGDRSISVSTGGSTTFPPIQVAEEGEWMYVAVLVTDEPDPPDADTVLMNYVPPTIDIVQPEQYYSWYSSLDSLNLHFETEYFEFSGPNEGNRILVNVRFSADFTEPGEPFASFEHFSADSIWIHFDGIGAYYVRLRLLSPPGPYSESYGEDSLQVDVGESADEDLPSVPASFALHPAYPNPLNPETTISYDVQKTSHVILTVHDLLGRTIATLLNETRDAGSYSVIWSGKNDSGESVSSGVYFVRMSAESFTGTQKLMLIR